MVVVKEATPTNFLPFDILRIILLKLPAKSLHKFKVVCKSWNAIFSHRNFALNHLQHSKNSIDQNTFLCIVTKACRQEYHLVKFENNKLQAEAIHEQRYAASLLCYADGLALLSTSSSPCSTSYLLWNPSSKQQEIISWPDRLYCNWKGFGFCRGPTRDDYKIVARNLLYYAVFSCKNKVWTMKKDFTYATSIYTKGGLFVDGFSFWVTRDARDCKVQILCFDPRDEKFKKLQKPREIEDIEDFHLTSLKGCLCLYNTKTYGDQKRFTIWMSKDCSNVDSNSWTKLMTVNNDIVVREPEKWNMIIPLLLTEKNDLVFCSGYEQHVFRIYNSTKERLEEIYPPASLTASGDLEIVPCPDSLFFPI